MCNRTVVTLCLFALGFVGWGGVVPNRALGHCQMPCGIYDDEARIADLREDAATIAKATDQLSQLAGKTDVQSLNQLVRWVQTKEAHASHIITVVSEYFLTQKVKPIQTDSEGYKEYLQLLSDHHSVMVAAMKTKQRADSDAVEALTKAVDRLAKHYHTD